MSKSLESKDTKGKIHTTIIHGASDYLKGQVQLSQIKEGETIIVISNGKVLQSDPYQFDTIYGIRPQ